VNFVVKRKGVAEPPQQAVAELPERLPPLRPGRRLPEGEFDRRRGRREVSNSVPYSKGETPAARWSDVLSTWINPGISRAFLPRELPPGWSRNDSRQEFSEKGADLEKCPMFDLEGGDRVWDNTHATLARCVIALPEH
jgi:hypothetical protein